MSKKNTYQILDWGPRENKQFDKPKRKMEEDVNVNV
jgi:hypothetical protein